MAKIKINKLPKGFKVQNGKVVKEMQQGGSTGDQFNYGLYTGPNSSEGNSFNNSLENNVRYSLSSVPREVANIEAEGGETVLTDLNNNGEFGLYDIKGPRHTNGGVPLYLPEQSFVFSDTKAMKFKKNELAEFGIESKKGMTPAAISKRYKLNEFIGALQDEDADYIKRKSAELMMDKNMKGLSKLAFGQEAKKQFSDGVPLAAYPYLISQGQDPIEFTQQVEGMNQKQAMMKAIGGLPPEQQAQALAMIESQSMGQPMARNGYELPKAQLGIFTTNPAADALLNWWASSKAKDANEQKVLRKTEELKQKTKEQGSYADQLLYGSEEETAIPSVVKKGTTSASSLYAPIERPLTPQEFSALSRNSNPYPVTTNTTEPATEPAANNNNRRRVVNTQSGDGKVNQIWSPERLAFYEQYGFDMNDIGIGERAYENIQPSRGGGLYGDALSNIEGWKEAWSGKYPDADKLIASLPKYGKNQKNPEVEKFQRWFNNDYIPNEVEASKEKAIAAGKEWTDEMSKTLTDRLLADTGFNSKTRGKGFDGKMGTVTSSIRPFSYLAEQKPQVETPEEIIKPEEKIDVKPGTVEYPNVDPDKQLWLQDMIKMAALAQRDRDMFLSWIPQLETPKADYVLEEPTRQLADSNEQLNIAAQAFGAFAGPQALSARISKAQGDTFRQNANTFAQVHSRNIGTVNQGLARNAQFKAITDAKNAAAKTKQYDDTMLTLQNYMDEKNLDREQMADLQANAYTNMANAYNLNTLNPYFNTNPNQAGVISFTGGPALAASKQAGTQMDIYDQMSLRAKELKASGLDGTTINKILDTTYGISGGNQSATVNPTANAYKTMKSQLGQGYTAKKGKEIKKYATPFYIGKTTF